MECTALASFTHTRMHSYRTNAVILNNGFRWIAGAARRLFGPVQRDLVLQGEDAAQALEMETSAAIDDFAGLLGEAVEPFAAQGLSGMGQVGNQGLGQQELAQA